MNGLHFRQAREKDFPYVERLARELHALHAAARPDCFCPAGMLYRPEEFRKLLKTEGTELHVAVTPEGILAAYALLSFRETAPGHGVRVRFFCGVDEFCVSPDFRRQGIGRAFFSYLESRARLNGAESIELTVWDFNHAAASFYADAGLTPRVHRLEKKL